MTSLLVRIYQLSMQAANVGLFEPFVVHMNAVDRAKLDLELSRLGSGVVVSGGDLSLSTPGGLVKIHINRFCPEGGSFIGNSGYPKVTLARDKNPVEEPLPSFFLGEMR